MSPVHDFTVPIFSLSDLRNPTPGQESELRKCILEKGLFYLKDYDIQESEHELLKTTTLNFFERNVDEERDRVIINIPGTRRGYSQLESESTARMFNNGNYTDYSVCYSMGLCDNVFPSKDFEQIWTNYFHRMYSTSQEIAKIVLEAGVADCGESIHEFVKCDPVLRFRHYPEVPENRCSEYEPLRLAPHHDRSIVTLIHQTPCANGFVSLQYEDRNGYLDVPFVPNTLLVMCGAVAAIVSNGKVRLKYKHSATFMSMIPSSSFMKCIYLFAD